MSGTTLTWVGPSGGGANNGHPVQQSRTLTASGALVLSTANQVIQGLDISSVSGPAVEINANNVTLKQCRIICGGFEVLSVDGNITGVIIEDCEFDGQSGTDGSSALILGAASNNGTQGSSGPLTIRRTNIHSCCNGISCEMNAPSGGTILIQDNYIHGLTTSGTGHVNGFQYNGGVGGSVKLDLEHNAIENNYPGNVTQPGAQTDCVMVDDAGGGPIQDITVNNNLLRGGGDFCIYLDTHFNGSTITNVNYTNNAMQMTAPFPANGYHDFNPTAPTTFTGNYDYITLAPIT